MSESETGTATGTAAAEGLRRLERELKVARRWAQRSTKELHAAMLKDLRAADGRVRRLETRLADARTRAKLAEKRAEAAERELAALKGGPTGGRAGVVERLKKRRASD